MLKSEIDERIYREARIALLHIVDGARYQLEAAHRRPDGTLDEDFNESHDELIEHLREEMEAVGTFKDMEANEEGFGEPVSSLE